MKENEARRRERGADQGSLPGMATLEQNINEAGRRVFRGTGQHVQRPWGASVPDVFAERQAVKDGWSEERGGGDEA